MSMCFQNVVIMTAGHMTALCDWIQMEVTQLIAHTHWFIQTEWSVTLTCPDWTCERLCCDWLWAGCVVSLVSLTSCCCCFLPASVFRRRVWTSTLVVITQARRFHANSASTRVRTVSCYCGTSADTTPPPSMPRCDTHRWSDALIGLLACGRDYFVKFDDERWCHKTCWWCHKLLIVVDFICWLDFKFKKSDKI